MAEELVGTESRLSAGTVPVSGKSAFQKARSLLHKGVIAGTARTNVKIVDDEGTVSGTVPKLFKDNSWTAISKTIRSEEVALGVKMRTKSADDNHADESGTVTNAAAADLFALRAQIGG